MVKGEGGRKRQIMTASLLAAQLLAVHSSFKKGRDVGSATPFLLLCQDGVKRLAALSISPADHVEDSQTQLQVQSCQVAENGTWKFLVTHNGSFVVQWAIRPVSSRSPVPIWRLQFRSFEGCLHMPKHAPQELETFNRHDLVSSSRQFVASAYKETRCRLPYP